VTSARRLIPVVTLLLCIPVLSAAQPLAGHRRDRARTFLVLRLADALNLSDAKALEVSGIIRKADEERRQLREKRSDIEKQIRAELGRSPLDADAVSKLVAQANQVDEQLAMIPEHSFQSAQKILTVEQQAKLVLFRPEIQKQIRRAVRRRLQMRSGAPNQPED